MNHRLLALALGTFAIGTGSFVFAGLIGVSSGWTGALCTLLSLAVLAVGTCAKGLEAAPEG